MNATRSVLLSQRIFDELEVDIVARTYPPGSHLTEDDIATKLGVSRTPVREAFRMLVRAGWLQIEPHSGARVRNPTMDEVRQVFEVRELLEERATRLAARHISAAELKGLGKTIERGRRAVEKGNIKQIASLNSEFHVAIASAARNGILAGLLGDLGKQVQWHFASVAIARGASSWEEHERILAALERGDEETAGLEAVEHCRRTHEAFFMKFLANGEDVTTPGA